MDPPKFMLAETRDGDDTLHFVLHTEEPAFLVNLEGDEVVWLGSPPEDADLDDGPVEELVQAALAFFDEYMGARYP